MVSLSVVIPARNDSEMLVSCLAALDAQFRRADEIIVVDNASTDATAQVAVTAGTIVISEPKIGIWPAAATGYNRATGDIIVRIDADSRPPADWLEKVAEAFAAHPETEFFVGGARFYGRHAVVNWLGNHLYIGGMFWSMIIYLGHAPLFGSNFAMRRDAWRELRGEVHSTVRTIHDDLDLSLHIKPWMPVLLDRSVSVEISARPFDSWSALWRRVSWVWPTLANHWPDDSPWRRRTARKEWLVQHTEPGDDEVAAST